MGQETQTPMPTQAQAQAPIAEIMRMLTAELPLNDFGLPQGIYRSDLLPFHLYDPHTRAPEHTPALSLDAPHTNGKGHDKPSFGSTDTTKPSTLIPAADDAPHGGVSQEPLEDSLPPTTSSAESPVDPFSLLSGKGDGLPDMMMRKPVRSEAVQKDVRDIGEYRIAGFPADKIQQAFVPLQYDEGFPAFEDGQVFWGKLPYEPADAYMAFERYLLMAQGSMGDPTADEYTGTSADGIRAIDRLVAQMSTSLGDTELLILSNRLKEYYHLYYWGLRTRSYDLFRVTQYRQQQELRAIETMDDHYIQSRKMRHRLTQYMESDEEFWELMTPKIAVDMHKYLTGLERTSAGVQANGKDDSQGQGQSFEIAFKTIAQSHRGETHAELLNEDGEVLDKALEDPYATEVLQELIIRTGGGIP